MKARVKATGEIVEISESSTIYDAGMCHIYNASELENVPDTNPDYWTRLEHQDGWKIHIIVSLSSASIKPTPS